MSGYSWSCTCGSTGRKAFGCVEQAEQERARHERQRCGPRQTSKIDTLTDTIPVDTGRVPATDHAP